MEIRAYSGYNRRGYNQPMNGLVDDLLSAGQTFLAAQAAPVIQAVAPAAAPQAAPAPAPVLAARPVMDMDAPASAATTTTQTSSTCLSPWTLLILALIVYYLFRKK